MLIEMHILQNHAPANLNRDDTGSPKDCVFGGVRRSRISSQCLKRSIRKSPLFVESLSGAGLALRTRHLPDQVKRELVARGVSAELAEIAAEKATGFGNKDGKEQGNGKTAQIMFLTQADVMAVADVMSEIIAGGISAKDFKKMSAKDLQAKAASKTWRPVTVDVALFGRMITSEAFRDVDAAMQVAHAISTNKMDHEFDYFTAVDDLQGTVGDEDDAGAGMIGDIEFNSACYYKYFSLDLDQLVTNLAGPDAQARAEAVKVARVAVSAFLRAAVFTTPSGKQNTFAAHQLPDAVLVEVRPHRTPVSYANAFVKPARAHGEVDLIEDTLAKFTSHVDTASRKFSLEASPRLWFSTHDQPELPGASVCDTFDELIAALEAALQTSEISHV